MSHTRHTRSTLPNPELHADERNDSASTTALQPSVALGSPFPPPPPSGSAAALHSPAGSAAGHPKASQRVGGSNRKARRYTMQQQEGDNMHLGKPASSYIGAAEIDSSADMTGSR